MLYESLWIYLNEMEDRNSFTIKVNLDRWRSHLYIHVSARYIKCTLFTNINMKYNLCVKDSSIKEKKIPSNKLCDRQFYDLHIDISLLAGNRVLTD